MAIDLRKKERNAEKARNSFVTRRAETKLSALADIFRKTSGDEESVLTRGTLSRTLAFEKFRYTKQLSMQYNWENRFLSVNYNLEMNVSFQAPKEIFQECGDAVLNFTCDQKGLRGKRMYSWHALQWDGDSDLLRETIDRLENPLITDRLSALDLFQGELRHSEEDTENTLTDASETAAWTLRLNSLIGSASWIMIPPVTSMITPKEEECFRFYEMFELIGDAVLNNHA